MQTLWNEALYRPLYNLLFALTNAVPGADIGIAIILLTILVKLVLYPLTKKSLEGQLIQKELEPELNRIKKDYPDKKVQAEKTMALYKEKQVNPLAGCLPILIQLPVIFALYYVFLHGLEGQPGLLYSFIPAVSPNTHFLGIVDLTAPNIVFAVLAGASQFLQMRLSVNSTKVVSSETTSNEVDPNAMMKGMQTQMQYILPIMIIFIGMKLSAAIALYWIVSNIATTVQEWFVRRTFNAKKAAV